MPVIAAAGVFAGGAALATGTLTVLQTVAAIGSIVGGIGALTGNKTLMKVGAVAGLAGGIGAFAQSQGWIASGNAASALGDTANNTAAMANAPGVGVENVAPTVDASAAAGGTGATQGAIEAAAAGGGTGGLEGGVAGSVLEGATSSNITNASQALEGAAPTGLMGAGGQGGSTLSKAALDGTNAFGANSATGAFDLAQTGAGNSSIFDTLGGIAKSIFTNKDGSLNKDMVSIAANFVGGAFDERKAAEADWLEAKTNEINQQMANASAVPNLDIRASGRVKFRRGQPTYYAPRAGGLYNAR